MNTTKVSKLLVVAGILVLSGTVLAYAAEYPTRGGYNGMMGGGYGGGYGGGMMGGYQDNATIIDDKTAESDMAASVASAAIDKEANSITYSGKAVKIVMFAGAKDADEKFVIGGLVNPTLRIVPGANVTLEMINKDEDVPHGVLITLANPPYAYMSMMQGGIYPGTFLRPIPVATSQGYPAAQLSFVASQAGTYYYLCQYPGHAAKGMYGQIIIGQI